MSRKGRRGKSQLLERLRKLRKRNGLFDELPRCYDRTLSSLWDPAQSTRRQIYSAWEEERTVARIVRGYKGFDAAASHFEKSRAYRDSIGMMRAWVERRLVRVYDSTDQ